jgi:hypothetical protein
MIEDGVRDASHPIAFRLCASSYLGVRGSLLVWRLIVGLDAHLYCEAFHLGFISGG